MANVKINQLPLATTPLTGTEVFPLVQGTTTKQVSVANLFTDPVMVNPTLGTVGQADLINATGLPISTGVAGLGSGIATFLGTPSSANLRAAVTDETGTGALVFATSPTLVTPNLGTPSAMVATNITGTALGLIAGSTVTNANLTGAVTSVGNATSLGSFTSAQLRTALTDETGSGVAVFATSPTLVTPDLGTPSAGVLTNATGLPLTTGVTGTLGLGNGGTGQTTANAAFNALAPSQTGNSGKYLTTDGTNTSWGTNPLGTVTSVDVSGGTTGLTTSGGPVTTSGTITIGGTLATTNGGTGLTSFTANGVLYASSTSALTSGSALTFDGTNFNVIRAAATDQYMSLYADGTGPTFKFFGGAAGKIAGITADSASASMYFVNEGNKPFIYAINGSEQMRLTLTGLGIGTSSPTQKLSVQGAGRFYRNAASTIGAVASSGLLIDGAGSNGNISQIGFGYDATVLTYMPAAIYGITTTQSGNTAMAIGFATRNVTTDTAPEERMRLDSAGNLGLGVTPSAWYSTAKVIQFSTSGALWAVNSQQNTLLSTNEYLDSSAVPRYLATGFGMRYQQTDGQHRWYTAPSGTAGDAISFTQALTLDANGKLLLGTTVAPVYHMMKVTSSTEAGIVLTGTNSVANDGSFTVDVLNATILMVSENNTGDGGLFFCCYASSTITLLSDPNNRYATSITAGKICVTKSAASSTVTITNKVGSTKSITAGKFSTSD